MKGENPSPPRQWFGSQEVDQVLAISQVWECLIATILQEGLDKLLNVLNPPPEDDIRKPRLTQKDPRRSWQIFMKFSSGIRSYQPVMSVLTYLVQRSQPSLFSNGKEAAKLEVIPETNME